MNDQTDQNDQQALIEDTQVVDATVADNASQVSGGEVLVNMESMIKNHISAVDRINQEAKKYKEMLDDIFNNDETYKVHAEKAAEAAKVKGQTKAEILKRPHAKELDDKVKSLKAEVKELQGALSDYLQEYQRMSGVNEIEDDNGEVREIVYNARLIKKGSKFA